MNKQLAEETAANRLRIISPLLDPMLDSAKRNQLKNELASHFRKDFEALDKSL